MTLIDCPSCKQRAEGYDSPNIPYCKTCWRAYSARYRKAHLPAFATYQAKRRMTHPGEATAINRKCWAKNKDKYNATRKRGGPSLYDQMFESQAGVCAVCRKPERSGRYKTLTVDHCHASEKIRGLLCSTCNRAIGMMGDNPLVLEVAARYLRVRR